ncbi:MAG: RimK family alpha-L-glutamate ligase [Candidatus Shapirobacteria bacterium]|jgi:RimK family alpha-L-glutamate ligase
MTKVAVFYGGKLTDHLVMLKRAGKKEGVELKLFSYNKVVFSSDRPNIMLRDGLTKSLKSGRDYGLDYFDVLFFRTAKKHWQEVSWLVDEAKILGKIIVDPVVGSARPTDACKAFQMLQMLKAGIPTPKTLYGSLGYLLTEAPKYLGFPVIIKGSGGHRGGSVYKADNKMELDKIMAELRPVEIAEGRRYLAQEFIKNSGDYRVIVLGDKVLGAMKRSAQVEGEFRNNFSRGGTVELAELDEETKKLCVKAAKACGLWVAGVDLVFANDDKKRPMFWEVNRGPQFRGFMQATGIDVPREIVRFLVSLKLESPKSPKSPKS